MSSTFNTGSVNNATISLGNNATISLGNGENVNIKKMSITINGDVVVEEKEVSLEIKNGILLITTK